MLPILTLGQIATYNFTRSPILPGDQITTSVTSNDINVVCSDISRGSGIFAVNS